MFIKHIWEMWDTNNCQTSFLYKKFNIFSLIFLFLCAKDLFTNVDYFQSVQGLVIRYHKVRVTFLRYSQTSGWSFKMDN